MHDPESAFLGAFATPNYKHLAFFMAANEPHVGNATP
jgi:hypothetical protein